MKEEGKEDCSSLLVLNKYILGYKTREKNLSEVTFLCSVWCIREMPLAGHQTWLWSSWVQVPHGFSLCAVCRSAHTFFSVIEGTGTAGTSDKPLAWETDSIPGSVLFI